MTSSENILSVSHLTVDIDGHVILKDVSFDVKRDSTVVVLGPNGAGKTVLFKAIIGLMPYSGQVTWKTDVKIGYVPQKISFEKDFPLTVLEFMQFKEKRLEEIQHALKEVGLWKESSADTHRGTRLLHTKIGVLSGGELQRVLIAFALLGTPNILFFDEPTSGVDITGEETVYTLMRRLQKQKDLTILCISHELDIVNQYADAVLCLNKEKMCFGAPKNIINANALESLYGEKIHLYTHGH